MDLREKFFNELVDELTKQGVRRLKTSTPVNGKTLKLNGIVLCKISKNSPYKENGLVIWKHLTQDALDLVGGMRAKGKKSWAAAPLTNANYSELMKLLTDVAIKSKQFKTTMRPKRKRKRTPRKDKYYNYPGPESLVGIITGDKIEIIEKESTTKPIQTPIKIKIKAKKRKRRNN